MKFLVDAVIPTFNSERYLERCLNSLAKQEDSEKINVIVIDGGSTDRTIQIARDFNCNVYSRPGMYSNGLNGARNLGLKFCKSEYYWQIDSDNELVEYNVFPNLMEPFANERKIWVSNPYPMLCEEDPKLSNWFAQVDLTQFEKLESSGNQHINFIIVEDLNYGLNNASIIRKDVLESVGGYDFDIRTLYRMRLANKSSSAIVPNAHYYHHSVTSTFDYAKKLSRRIKLYTEMMRETRDFLVSVSDKAVSGDQLKSMSMSLKSSIDTSIKGFVDDHEVLWLHGFLLPLAYLAAAISHPFLSLQFYRRFLKL